MPDPLVRDATADDAAACAAIYAPYVTGTTVTFETEPPDAAEMGRRIAKAQARHAFLVLEEDGDGRRLRVCRPVQGAGGVPVVVRGVGLPRAATGAGAVVAAGSTRRCSSGSRRAATGWPRPG